MPIVVDISWGTGGEESVLILGSKTIGQSTLIMISVEVIETSVTITCYLLSQLLRSTLTWKTKLSGPKVILCSNYSLFNTNRKKWIIRNSLSPCYH